MTELRHLTKKAVDRLRTSVVERLEWYYDPGELKNSPIQLSPDEWRSTRINTESLVEHMVVDDSRPSGGDADNALIVYKALSMLTPQQAADERFWAWMSHFLCAEYIAKRWLGSRPEDPEEAGKKVRNHFFARDTRALIRDHGVSRLWWLGYIAHEAHQEDPGLFLEIVLHRQDVRSALIERPSVSMNTQVLAGVFAVMHEHWEESGKQAALFKREVFRAWMTALNRRGGSVLMDALPEKPLMDLLYREADTALQAKG